MPDVILPSLHAGQREVVASTARFKVLAAGRRWRKTSLGVQVATKGALEYGRWWWVAPSYPVAHIGWRMARHLGRQIPGVEAKESERLLIFPGKGELQVKSADNPDSLRGSGLDGVVVDEAAYVKEEAWTEALRPALSDRLGSALFISSPHGMNWFQKLFEKAGATAGWERWQRPTWDNPHISREEIEAAREELGDIIFRQEYGAEFLEAATLKPFRSTWITYWTQDVTERPADHLVIEAGFDPAISKRDEAARSALVVGGQHRRGPFRGNIDILRAVAGHWSVYEQVDVILKAVRELKIRTVHIEDVAYQKGLGQVLDHEARLRGILVNVDLVKPDGDKLRRASAWSALVEDGTVRFGPEQRDLVESMLAVPHDESKWDLVDAAGILVRGFHRLAPEKMLLPEYAPTPTRAIGYATRPDEQARRPKGPIPHALPGQRRPGPTVKRAAGYAVGRKS